MSRYIDIEPILEWCDNPEVFEPYGVNSVELEKKIRQAPSIDICFCRECQRCSKDRIKWSVKDEDGNWIDTKCNLCRRTKLEVNLDDFCSWGEREGE